MLKPAQPPPPSQTLSRTLATRVGPCVWSWSPKWACSCLLRNEFARRAVCIIACWTRNYVLALKRRDPSENHQKSLDGRRSTELIPIGKNYISANESQIKNSFEKGCWLGEVLHMNQK